MVAAAAPDPAPAAGGDVTAAAAIAIAGGAATVAASPPSPCVHPHLLAGHYWPLLGIVTGTGKLMGLRSQVWWVQVQ